MNIIAKLTIRHLRENKKRTVVTVLGIAAATALVTTMLVGIYSFFSFFGVISLSQQGQWLAEFEDLTNEQINELRADDRISSVAVFDTEKNITGVRMHSDASYARTLGNIMHLDDVALKNKVTCDYEGALPSKENEIAIEEKFLEDNGLDVNPGDSLTFDLGGRYVVEPDGKKVYIAGNYHSNEEFEMTSDITCKVTAILHSNEPTDGFDILKFIDNTKVPQDNVVDICLKKLDFGASKQLDEIAREYGLNYSAKNTEMLISVFSFDKSSSGVAAVIPAGMVALGIIISVSVILIYNALGMSLMEKIRYLGMLASVGATKRQKRNAIYFEALILGMVGIPLGILIGYLGAYFTIGVLGKQMTGSGIILVGASDYKNIPVHAPIFVYVFIVGISLVTIFISALVPAIKASKIMPIDALKQANSIKVKPRKLRVNPLIRKVFGYEGELAYKNIKRNGTKGTIITVSIASSVIMFLTIMHFTADFEKANAYDFDLPYQIYVSCAVSDIDMLKEALASNKDVTKFYTSDMYSYDFKPDKDNPSYVPPKADILNTDYLNEGYKFVFDAKQINLCTIPDNEFNKLLAANDITKDSYYGDELKGVILNNYFRKSTKKEVFNEGILGQKLMYEKQEGNLPTVTVAGMVDYDNDNFIFNLVPKNTVVIYVPESMFYPRLVENMGADNATITCDVETENSEKLYDDIMDMLERDGYHNYSAGNITEALNAMKVVILILKTVMYGFTTLVTLIGLANMINTIYTGIIMRRKEFAMYRSVGLEEKGFNKMLTLEGLLYGIRALVIGIPLSLVFSYLMTKKADSQMAFEVNVPIYLMAIAVVFAVIGASMLLSLSRIKNDEIIEVLKDDIC